MWRTNKITLNVTHLHSSAVYSLKMTETKILNTYMVYSITYNNLA